MARTRSTSSGSSKRTRSTSGGGSKRSRSASGKSSQAGRSTKTSAARTSAARASHGTSSRSGGNRSGGAASSRRPDELKKEELVEQIGKHLRRLRRDDLVALVERLDAGTLDLPALAPSGEGGFGFQEQASSSNARSRVGGGAEKTASKAGSLAKKVVESPVVERVKEKVTPS